MKCHYDSPHVPGLGKQMVKDRYPILLIIAYVLSRLYWFSRGVRFDDYSNTSNMHLYAREAMNNNLWETLWYGHVQPPLYSLFLWAVGFNPIIVHICWLLLGIAAIIALYTLLMSLTKCSSVAFLTALIWTLLPSAILYESTIFYTPAVVCLLILSVWALQRNHMVLFSTLVCITILTRSMFHPLAWGLPVLLIGGWRRCRM